MADKGTRAKYARERRAAAKKIELAADDPRHGTFSCYTNLMCRCTSCKAANAEHTRNRRTK